MTDHILRMDKLREQKFVDLDNASPPSSIERTRDISVVSNSTSFRPLFPSRHQLGARELSYPASEAETIELDRIGIDLTERELAESTLKIMESVPIGKHLPTLPPLEASTSSPERILSKWRLPNGMVEWKEAKLLASQKHLDRYLIEWCHRPGLRKEVRRVNIVRNEDDVKRRENFLKQSRILRKRQQRAVKVGLHLPFMLEALRTRHIVDSSVRKDFVLKEQERNLQT